MPYVKALHYAEMLARVELEKENQRLRATLKRLADRKSWIGDPRSQGAVWYEHDTTPYELAVTALAEVNEW
jgi:hypothetical protein